MTQQELNWVRNGRSKIGLKEIPGAKHEPEIINMIRLAESATKQNVAWLFGKDKNGKTNYNDEVAWCGTFMAYCFATAGLEHHIPKEFYRAKEWAEKGTALNKPAYGAVVVFNRTGGGHVGIIVGQDKHGNLMVLGGNQNNAVNIMPFAKDRVLAYRWLGTQKTPWASRFDLPVLNSNGKVSTNEA